MKYGPISDDPVQGKNFMHNAFVGNAERIHKEFK